ncbi:hypothetical protein [Arsenophonus nasoniae]|uniref:Uncharacterized protein n=3 Tax=Arsenophonus nasoniae TaxID=638 RepID=A0AA95GW46_9GAMM|nr:hypothetical protein [Arsenophonus nasoniae]WGL93877.1 hypothetical protein QE207_00960 [Arsenophonus nasoniae]WGM03949.1 hypothetical protein QE210_21160 [Arsenophonus nasoniae]WGM09103.1 hypothetical protein QE258_27715 [Arsenophonus nasoniae]
MKKTTSDFKEDILRLREQGLSYERIAFWLAENKKFEVTANAIRLFIVKQKRIAAMKK